MDRRITGEGVAEGRTPEETGNQCKRRMGMDSNSVRNSGTPSVKCSYGSRRRARLEEGFCERIHTCDRKTWVTPL